MRSITRTLPGESPRSVNEPSGPLDASLESPSPNERLSRFTPATPTPPRVMRPVISTLGSSETSTVFELPIAIDLLRMFFVENPSRRNVKSCVPSATRIVYVPSLAVFTASSSLPKLKPPMTMRCIIPRWPVGVGAEVTATPESGAPSRSVTLPLTAMPLGIDSTRFARRSPGASLSVSDVAGGKPFLVAFSLMSESTRTRAEKRPSGPETAGALNTLTMRSGMSMPSRTSCVEIDAATTGFLSSFNTTPLTRASGEIANSWDVG